MIKGTVCREGGEAKTYADKRDESRERGLVAMPVGLTVAFVATAWTFARLVGRQRDEGPKLRTSSKHLPPPREDRPSPTAMDTAYAAQVAAIAQATAPTAPTTPDPEGPGPGPSATAGAPSGPGAGPLVARPATGLTGTVAPPPDRERRGAARPEPTARGAWMVVAALALLTVVAVAVVVVRRSDDGTSAPDLSTGDAVLEHIAREPSLEQPKGQREASDNIPGPPTFEHCGERAASDEDRVDHLVLFTSGADVSVQTEVVRYRPGKGDDAVDEMRRMLLSCPRDWYDNETQTTIDGTPAPERDTKGLLPDHIGWIVRSVTDEEIAFAEEGREPAGYVSTLLVQRRRDLVVLISGSDVDAVRQFARSAARRLRALDPDVVEGIAPS